MIDLYTAPTPNGWKASVALEELGLSYEVHIVTLLAGDQKQPEYLQLNAKSRVMRHRGPPSARTSLSRCAIRVLKNH
jgi:glutathione S-transferase-like protein